jgi:hypothetical protein
VFEAFKWEMSGYIIDDAGGVYSRANRPAAEVGLLGLTSKQETIR